MSMFQEEDPLLEEVRRLDIPNLTPLDAINKLYQLQEKLKRAGQPGPQASEGSGRGG